MNSEAPHGGGARGIFKHCTKITKSLCNLILIAQKSFSCLQKEHENRRNGAEMKKGPMREGRQEKGIGGYDAHVSINYQG